MPHQPNPLVSGLSTISTPAKPTAIATHCTRPTRSPSIKIDSNAISSGATKNIAYALASDSAFSANVKVTIMNTDITPRTRCSGQRTCDSCRTPPEYIAHANTTGKRGETAQRRHLRGG